MGGLVVAVLVSDTSVVIDLDRGGLLDSVFALPHDFAVPDLLFRRELEGALGDRLLALGLKVEELTPAEVTDAARLARREAALSGPDTFAYALARSRAWILLTGDGVLRRISAAERLAVHGVLWMIDQLDQSGIVGHPDLHVGLTAIATHPRCRLPRGEVTRRLNRYQGQD